MYHSVHFLEEVRGIDYCYIFYGYIPQIFVHSKVHTQCSLSDKYHIYWALR